MSKLKVYSDGSHNKGGLQTKSAIVIYKDDKQIDQFTYIGPAGWSDIAEYQAVVEGLKYLISMGYEGHEISWFNDSEFVMNQMAGIWKIKEGRNYSHLALKAKSLVAQFKNITFTWIPREQNTEADALSKL